MRANIHAGVLGGVLDGVRSSRPAGFAGLNASLRIFAAAALLGGLAVAGASHARAQAEDSKPYDEQLLRLAEILGSVHYLRELCSANDGQQWRERMNELLDTEGATALRRARLTRSFNQGYRSYRRTYATCTPSAQSSIERFLAEGIEIGDGLVKNAR